MRFEYILLICVFILPIIYKLWYWQDIFEQNDYNLSKFWKYIRSKQGNESLLHFWIFLEIPILCLSIVPLFNPPFEIFLYNIMLYFGLLYNIFVLGKIFRKKMIFPRVNNIFIFTVLLFLFDWVASYLVNYIYLYIFLSCWLLLMPLYFIAAIFVENFWNTKFLKYYK